MRDILLAVVVLGASPSGSGNSTITTAD